MNTNPQVRPDPVTLSGLEGFLERAHVEVVEPVVEPAADPVLEKTTVYYETRTLLELLGQVHKVHELLAETNRRLTRAYARIKHMERVVEEQEQKLELIPVLENQARRATELQSKLDIALTDLEKLRQPWWHRLSNNGVHKIK